MGQETMDAVEAVMTALNELINQLDLLATLLAVAAATRGES